MVVAGGLGMAGCGSASPNPSSSNPWPPLKTLSPFPFGAAAPSAYLDDPDWVELAQSHLSQITPEWELNREYIAQEDGSLRFDAPDRLAAFCRQNGIRFFGHCLVWYAQIMPYFRGLDASLFAAEYDRYIQVVMRRYAGQMVGWNVVNEAVAEDGGGLRDCLWSERLGGGVAYIRRAFEQARLADPAALLFLNDYNLENNPAKGATFLKLVEKLLKLGTPIDGIGCQSHLDLDIADGQIRTFLRNASDLGLRIHISELDASLRRDDGKPDLRNLDYKIARQRALITELTQAFLDLPASQQFGFTTWALRNRDSWLRRPPRGDGRDSMVFLNDHGQPTAMYDAFATVVTHQVKRQTA